jgi:hypothetical protein
MMPCAFLIVATSLPADAEIALSSICEQEHATPKGGKTLSS